MEFKIITDKESARKYFKDANANTTDKNHVNYTDVQFDIAWDLWVGFFVLFNDDEPVSFCGIRRFDDNYVRIFDRYYVYPDYRKSGLSNAVNSLSMIATLLEHVGDAIPFFSIENEKNAAQKAVDMFNQVLLEEDHFHLIDGLYETAGNSWQYIALQKPHTTISLPKKPE